MGKKYIVELESGTHIFILGPEGIVHIGEPDVVYETVDGMQIGDAVINAKPYTELDLEQVKKDYDAFYEHGYEQGLADAWEAARKILFNPDDGGMSAIDVNEVFGESSWTVMKDFSASEVVAKIKEYEDSKQKIKVGDEVEDGVANLVVLEINEDGTVEGFTDYGSVVHAIPRKKTGRYFPEVVALLKNMKGK